MKKVYLAGSIESAEDNGETWRNKITPKLKALGIEVWDPCKKEIEKTGFSPGEAKEKIYGYKRSGNWQLFQETMKVIREADLAAVLNSDFLIVYLDTQIPIGGTICEVQKAFDKKIPIYAVLRGNKSDVNSWTLSMVLENGQIFENFSQLLKFLESKYREGKT